MDSRTRRVGQNEALFRQVNERVRDLSETFGAVTGSIALVCECGNVDCVEQVNVPPDEYAAIRADPLLFIVKPGHESADVEEVVARHGDYEIVSKHPGSPAVLAEETDATS